jgi:hypothetical protein
MAGRLLAPENQHDSHDNRDCDSRRYNDECKILSLHRPPHPAYDDSQDCGDLYVPSMHVTTLTRRSRRLVSVQLRISNLIVRALDVVYFIALWKCRPC